VKVIQIINHSYNEVLLSQVLCSVLSDTHGSKSNTTILLHCINLIHLCTILLVDDLTGDTHPQTQSVSAQSEQDSQPEIVASSSHPAIPSTTTATVINNKPQTGNVCFVFL